jgi:hypothetical protein
MPNTKILIVLAFVAGCSGAGGTSVNTQPDAPRAQPDTLEPTKDTSPTQPDTQPASSTATSITTGTETKADAGTTPDSLPQITPDSSVPDAPVQVVKPDALPMAQDTLPQATPDAQVIQQPDAPPVAVDTKPATPDTLVLVDTKPAIPDVLPAIDTVPATPDALVLMDTRPTIPDVLPATPDTKPALTGRCTINGALAPATTMCSTVSGLPGGTIGPIGGPCGYSIYCTGTTPDCPPRTYEMNAAAAGTLCRPATGVCTVAGYCSGVSLDCEGSFNNPQTQADVHYRSTVCRPKVSECGHDDSCTGSSPDCPSAVFMPAGYSCGGGAGACTGNSATCSFSDAGMPPCGEANQRCCTGAGIQQCVFGRLCATGGTRAGTCDIECGHLGQPPCGSQCLEGIGAASCHGGGNFPEDPTCVACGAHMQKPCCGPNLGVACNWDGVTGIGACCSGNEPIKYNNEVVCT